MSVGSIIRKALKEGYYVVSHDDIQYASSEFEALRLVESLDKMSRDSAVYSYRDGVFRHCLIVDVIRTLEQTRR